MASAQVYPPMAGKPDQMAGKPDQGYWLPADSTIGGACPPPSGGADYCIPPDSEVGLPILGPPDGDFMLLEGQWNPTVDFIHPGGEGDDFPVLCPLKKPPDQRGVLLWADGSPFGTGTYHWLCAPAETGCHAFYTSTTCGLTLTTKASYTWDGETSPEKESGYIRVFDADLTFEGGDPDAQCNVEAETGFFMAVGGPRKLLTLRLQPSDPEDVFPLWFMCWWENDPQPPPPYGTGLSLSGPGCVSFYSQPESGEVLTDLSWGWEETEPYGFTHTATPTQLYVQAVTPGTCTIQMGLGYNTWDSCWPPEADAWDTVKVTVVDVDLTAWDLDGQVPEAQEENPGAFVHYNVDNDNSSDNSQGAPKHPGWDCAEGGPVSGENDLKLLKMSVQPALTQGVVTLSRNQVAVRVWKSATKGAGNEILLADSTKQWDLSDAQQRADFNAVKDALYVEGYGSVTSTLTLAYAPPGGQAAISDQVKYTFIAADCGEQPKTEPVPTKLWNYDTGEWITFPDLVQRGRFTSLWPALVGCQWSVTAQFDHHDGYHWALKEYNCIAWSVDETDHRYTEQEIIETYGNISNFYLQKKGWTPIQGGTDEEKAAQAEGMYFSGFHAARRKGGCSCGVGRWIMYESKVGQWERIEHVWNQLNGTTYGSPVGFYK